MTTPKYKLPTTTVLTARKVDCRKAKQLAKVIASGQWNLGEPLESINNDNPQSLQHYHLSRMIAYNEQTNR